MALMTPMLTTIESFDATKGQTVTFVVTSGDQVVKNRITVMKRSVVIFSCKERSDEPAEASTSRIKARSRQSERG